jgi:hypothetical protein
MVLRHQQLRATGSGSSTGCGTITEAAARVRSTSPETDQRSPTHPASQCGCFSQYTRSCSSARSLAFGRRAGESVASPAWTLITARRGRSEDRHAGPPSTPLSSTGNPQPLARPRRPARRGPHVDTIRCAYYLPGVRLRYRPWGILTSRSKEAILAYPSGRGGELLSSDRPPGALHRSSRCLVIDRQSP